MSIAKGVLFLYTQSWLHPGAGASTGAIDLPIQREVHTEYPVIPASGVKGSLRDQAESVAKRDIVDGLFGPEVSRVRSSAPGDTGSHFAGALSVGDAKILLFPVRSLTRSFCWVTCPLVLSRLWRDMKTMGIDVQWQAPSEVQPAHALMAGKAPERLFLEDMGFEPSADPQIAALAAFLANCFPASVIGQAFHDKLKTDVVVINNEDFKYLAKYATQVSARTQLTSNKTTDKTIGPDGKEEKGNLWYEETLPPETVFYVPIMAEPARGGEAKSELASGDAVMDQLNKVVLQSGYIQLGGNETLGHGLCSVFLARGSTR
ncbi:MAG: type III-B CRISPR module RAMP protein Cmr4 [Bacteroidota bacterium]